MCLWCCAWCALCRSADCAVSLIEHGTGHRAAMDVSRALRWVPWLEGFALAPTQWTGGVGYERAAGFQRVEGVFNFGHFGLSAAVVSPSCGDTGAAVLQLLLSKGDQMNDARRLKPGQSFWGAVLDERGWTAEQAARLLRCARIAVTDGQLEAWLRPGGDAYQQSQGRAVLTALLQRVAGQPNVSRSTSSANNSAG